MERGDSLIFNVQVLLPPTNLPPSVPVVPVAQNITGWTMWFTLKNNFQDPDSVAVSQLKSGGAGITFLQPLIGLAQVNMPAQATVGFPDAPVVLFYDVQAKDLSGNIYTVETGTVTVNPDLTRAVS